jgi:beta-fructofuranosidase
VQRDRTWYLFMGPSEFGEAMAWQQRGEDPDWRTAYSSTVVLASDDPLHFDRADEVGLIRAHASEVIVDETGEAWISHCGWGQGGVHLARLHFD